MKKNINISGFTLVEVLVAMTVFSIVMVSVLMIYAASSQITLKTDINREMQQNIKSMVETIAEDVRKKGITGVSKTIGVYDTINTHMYMSGSALQVGNNQYYIVKKGGTYGQRLGNIAECEDIKIVCILFKHSTVDGHIGPLTNSKISVSRLNFNVSGGKVPKVHISFVAKAAARSGVRSEVIRNSTLNFQTTLSERSLQIK